MPAKPRYTFPARYRWLFGALTLLMMAAIFVFSAMPGKDSSKLSGQITDFLIRAVYPEYDTMSVQQQAGAYRLMEHLVRKCAHFTEYALLGILALLFLDTFSVRFRPFMSLLLTAVYAVSDEWHQGFVAGRGPMLQDVVIDTAGAAAGILITFVIIELIRLRRQS